MQKNAGTEIYKPVLVFVVSIQVVFNSVSKQRTNCTKGMATCYRTKGKGDNLQGTKQNVPDKLHFEQKYHVYSRIRNRVMPVGWHMKKKREMANYFTSSDPNHGISRDIF